MRQVIEPKRAILAPDPEKDWLAEELEAENYELRNQLDTLMSLVATGGAGKAFYVTNGTAYEIEGVDRLDGLPYQLTVQGYRGRKKTMKVCRLKRPS